MKKLVFALFFLLLLNQFSAQETLIDSVLIDNQYRKVSKTAKIENINSDKILQNSTSLSDLLRFQSNIYIKENGRGATSSPSFRGTTAQQTAFVWNGININSVFLGQGDINTLSPLSYENVGVKYGGGSVVYGSGAIGGSIHLNNILDYNKGFRGNLFSEYSSFATINSLASAKYSDENFSFNFNINHSQSENEYEVEEKYYKNRNGAYQNSAFNLGIAYKISPNNELYWQTQLYDGVQNYALLSEFSTPTKYQTQNFRSLLGWKLKNRKLSNEFKIAYLTDDYQYFSNSTKNDSQSSGASEQYILKSDFNYELTQKSSFNTILEYNYLTSENFNTQRLPANRNQGSIAVLYRNNELKNLFVEVGVKKDFVEGFSSPYLFSAGASYQAKPWYQVKLNLSKNFRAPSFNDLYWVQGGNLNLKSETSHQAELAQTIKLKNWKLFVTSYFMDIKDMIRWLPNITGMYEAANTDRVKSWGLESQVGYNYVKNNHHIETQISYSYTQSTDQKLKKQLPYVPFHNLSGYFSYHYKKYQIFAQGIWNGKIFSDSEESEKLALESFAVINGGISIEIIRGVKLGLKVNNITDKVYRTVYGYYMPKRNFAIHLNLNF
ncbi:TonB-dependent receptor [Epilithonimonas sp.]|uniref:TonB-dependent receptor n=1 Tax=Epilithonimonas sp. TaxID=2894511 RepID=UPI002FDE3D10